MTAVYNPLVSIIVPVYNVEAYLRRCVDSVVSQTYGNIEIILVDDGSTDGCSQMCDEYALKDKRIKVIHKKNGGLSDARNVGIDSATGEYLSFIDSDDVVHVDFVKVLHTAIQESSKLVSVCLFQNFSDEEPLVFDAAERPAEVMNLFDSISAYCTLTPAKSTPLISCCTKLYHKSLFQKIRFPVGKIYEDGRVSYKLLDEAGGVAFVNKRLYGYFIRSDSIMGRKEYHASDEMLQPYRDAICYFRDNKKENVAQLFYPPLLMREVFRYWIAKEQKKDVQEAEDLLETIRNDCRIARSCENVKLIYKIIFSVIVFFPSLYSIYRKIAAGRIGGR